MANELDWLVLTRCVGFWAAGEAVFPNVFGNQCDPRHLVMAATDLRGLSTSPCAERLLQSAANSLPMRAR